MYLSEWRLFVFLLIVARSGDCNCIMWSTTTTSLGGVTSITTTGVAPAVLLS